ncbi:MAG: hypothetical protein IBX64_13750, partial [Actinobacteria bacterium]|nr:hypothetical protein [Actinomycetota bacterium]
RLNRQIREVESGNLRPMQKAAKLADIRLQIKEISKVHEEDRQEAAQAPRQVDPYYPDYADADEDYQPTYGPDPEGPDHIEPTDEQRANGVTRITPGGGFYGDV